MGNGIIGLLRIHFFSSLSFGLLVEAEAVLHLGWLRLGPTARFPMKRADRPLTHCSGSILQLQVSFLDRPKIFQWGIPHKKRFARIGIGIATLETSTFIECEIRDTLTSAESRICISPRYGPNTQLEESQSIGIGHRSCQTPGTPSNPN